MSNHEQIIMAMTADSMTATDVSEHSAAVNDAHGHEHLHEHNHDHSHDHDHAHESHATDEKLTIRQRMGNWIIGKTGIMQNQHIENITAATCCGAVCRGDLPIVAAYLGTTAVAALRTPKNKTESTPAEE